VRNYPGASVITRTVSTSWDRLLLPIFFLMVITITFGCLMFTIEYDAEKGNDQNFPEMASACWFTLVTMTTTGYGRIMPEKSTSKALAMLMMILGNFYMAMPLTIVGSTFWGHYQTLQEKIEQVKKAKLAILDARRKPVELKSELDKAKFHRERSRKALKNGKLSAEDMQHRMLPPVQEQAYHELFAMEQDINELLHIVQRAPETEVGLADLMMNPKVVDISRRMGLASRMMSYMVKENLDAAHIGNTTALNRHAPIGKKPEVPPLPPTPKKAQPEVDMAVVPNRKSTAIAL
jgi:hypothetical protein